MAGQSQRIMKIKEEKNKERKIKKALYMKYNSNINMDKGIAVGERWTNIKRATNYCLLNGSPAEYTIWSENMSQETID
ncbi:hypothetical protein M513_02294 [Trichuris suis]|uniref:Uncharacterized protein n=1 Tax=Trichuris suis TaxID=68888 RepID=A0A085MHC2_9BILA|nr:hypothetical protein M513_02294 [Trichuris suis]